MYYFTPFKQRFIDNILLNSIFLKNSLKKTDKIPLQYSEEFRLWSLVLHLSIIQSHNFFQCISRLYSLLPESEGKRQSFLRVTLLWQTLKHVFSGNHQCQVPHQESVRITSIQTASENSQDFLCPGERRKSEPTARQLHLTKGSPVTFATGVIKATSVPLKRHYVWRASAEQEATAEVLVQELH